MQGGIIDKEMPIDASNVAVISPQDGKATRIGYRIANDGSKVRICRRTGADLYWLYPNAALERTICE